MTSPVEQYVRYSTSVQSVPDAFAFVMTYLDHIQEPDIHIAPRWDLSRSDDGTLYYEVIIGGTPK